MDFNFDNILSQLLISCAGMGFFMYGKKSQRLFPLLAGILMCAYPYFINNVWILWGVTVALIVALYILREH